MKLLSGWLITGQPGATWDSGTAHIGRPGTPGDSTFSQTFDIAAGTQGLEINFDYEWQVNQPANEDFFTAELIYETTSGSGTITETLLFESSDDGTFSPPATMFSTVIGLTDLKNVVGNGTIRFTLDENNSRVGTRIELDNVSVSAIPEAASVIIWSALGVIGLTANRRHRTR